MKTATLQRLIAQNAALITELHTLIEDYVDEAKFWKLANERAFSLDVYKHVSKLRKQLSKAVATQVELKEEVAHNAEEARFTQIMEEVIDSELHQFFAQFN